MSTDTTTTTATTEVADGAQKHAADNKEKKAEKTEKKVNRADVNTFRFYSIRRPLTCRLNLLVLINASTRSLLLDQNRQRHGGLGERFYCAVLFAVGLLVSLQDSVQYCSSRARAVSLVARGDGVARANFRHR
jgi:hypothetical protein